MSVGWLGPAWVGDKQRQENLAMGNHIRVDGYDRCYCGCKYWEDDRCADCGGRVPVPEDEL
jgi:hypothetical protein